MSCICRCTAAALLCVVVSLLSTMTTAISSPVVETRQGPVKGFIDHATDGRQFFAFKGIPFAQPPVGKLRFKDPRPANPWSGTLDAVHDGSPCVQYPFQNTFAGVWIDMFGHEDCLFLNVFTPTVEQTRKLPVMVYIHGGAFLFGDTLMSPPHSILTQDIVLVVLQYRLGTFGFLSTEDDSAPGNLGLKDQNLALHWVQQNVASFGGDPDMVTLFGESAGSASTHFQLLTEKSDGLFQRAILQSGTGLNPWAIAQNARRNAYAIGKDVGCITDVSSEQLIQCLQEKSAEELSHSYSLFYEYGIFPLTMAPIVDGEFLKAHPGLLMKEGKMSKVDLMAGVTRNEGGFISGMIFSSEQMLNDLLTNFTVYGPPSIGITSDSYDPLAQATKAFARYIGDNIFSDQLEDVTSLFGDRFFKIGYDNTMLAHLKTYAGTGKRIYAYDFNYRGAQSFQDLYPMQYVNGPATYKKWVGHADDLAYLFPGSSLFKAHDNEADKEMTNRMVKLWTNFAATGNPTPDASQGFVWEAAEDGRLRHLVIQPQPYMADDHRQEIREFWNNLPIADQMLVYPEMFADYLDKKTPSKTEL
uniref:Carboxylic ester hydrolase n=1 Tax=Hirondellea gigas TaxID=1518452 RepID=A0A2P2HXS8_9CRUS